MDRYCPANLDFCKAGGLDIMWWKIILCLCGSAYLGGMCWFIDKLWSAMPIKEEKGGAILYIKKELFK